MNQSQNVDLARRYLTAIERGATGDDLAAFFAPNVVQQEFPNRLMPTRQRNYDCFEPW